MSNYLWRVTANKTWNVVAKGMEVDVVVSNRSGKPYIKEIATSLINKK